MKRDIFLYMFAVHDIETITIGSFSHPSQSTPWATKTRYSFLRSFRTIWSFRGKRISLFRTRRSRIEPDDLKFIGKEIILCLYSQKFQKYKKNMTGGWLDVQRTVTVL